MVSPSDLWPSSRVSWNTRAAHRAGILMRRPRPSTLVWWSFVEVLFGGGFLLLLLLEGSREDEDVGSTRMLLLLLLLLDRLVLLLLVAAEEEGSTGEMAREG